MTADRDLLREATTEELNEALEWHRDRADATESVHPFLRPAPTARRYHALAAAALEAEIARRAKPTVPGDFTALAAHPEEGEKNERTD